MLHPEEFSKKRKGSSGGDSGDERQVVDGDASYPGMTFELAAQRSVATGGKTYRLVASKKIGKASDPPMWKANGAFHVSLLSIKPTGRKTGEKFKDHGSFSVLPYEGEIEMYEELAAETIARCDEEGLSTIVVNCHSGTLRSSILCCAIYMKLTGASVKAAMTAMKSARAGMTTTLGRETKHCVGAALGRKWNKL